MIDLFDRVAAGYDSVLPFFSEFGRLVAEQLPAPIAGARLLDIGAGHGAVAVAAHHRGYRVTATDAAPAMVARLRAEHGHLEVQLMDAAHLDFADGTFDVVTAGLMMHLVGDPKSVAQEVRRVLRPGGLFAFTTPGRVPDGFEFADGINELFGEFARHLPPQGSMGEPFDEIDVLVDAGFREVAEIDLRVALPVADPETLWQWLQTHGTRKFLEDLSADHRAAFHQRLIEDLQVRHPIVLRRYNWLYTGRA